jgi:RNA polymerase sigma-70 factor (ECF subfamily)
LSDDRQIWDRIRQGDAQAFGEFYRQNAPRLEAFLRHVVGDQQAAEDIMQETFTQIWSRPNGFQPERGALRPIFSGLEGNVPPNGGGRKVRKVR